MAGTGWGSADLLASFNAMAGRPSSGDTMTDAQKYTRLSQAQDFVYSMVMTTDPKVLYSAPTAMTTADGGYTFTFGTDGNGYALFPLGDAQIYTTLSGVPGYPLRPGLDYLDEGTQIRMPNNVPYQGTLYWRGVAAPAPITALVDPSLQPPQARGLIVVEAVRRYAQEEARNPALYQMMEAQWAEQWPTWITTMRKHFRGAVRLGPLTGAGYGALGSSYGPLGWGW